MSNKRHSVTSRFDVIIEFLNDDTVYGAERYVIEATDANEAKRIALQRSEDSLYDDDRIPDRRRRALITSHFDD
ncbi:hypothetical protein [Bradyrhizobium sp. STM 3562]|uniref:hypothetical protein n=1 Tax=Bradyrhizobium sp. STM 3562 TaxID=578924 RepID=UPI00388E7360